MGLNDDFPNIDPGRFRHQVTLLEPKTGVDASGTTTSWAPDATPVMASVAIEWLRGDELIKGGQDVTQAHLKMTGWYRANFTPNKRLQRTVAGVNYVYLIEHVENVKEMNIYMVLTCLGLGPSN